MDQVLTVIGDPASRALSQDQAQTALAALQSCGAETAAVDWLGRGTACDLPFRGVPADRAEGAARQALTGAPLDFSRGYQLANNRGIIVTNGRLHDVVLGAVRDLGVGQE